jgi:hypothetical protein
MQKSDKDIAAALQSAGDQLAQAALVVMIAGGRIVRGLAETGDGHASTEDQITAALASIDAARKQIAGIAVSPDENDRRCWSSANWADFRATGG